MKVRGDLPPSNAFTVENQPKRPGFALVRFYENVREFTEQDGDLTISGYEYDEYHLEIERVHGLEEYVLQNFDRLLRKARAADTQKVAETPEQKMTRLEAENAKLHGQVESLESELTDTQMALCDIYEMLGGAV